MDILPHMEGEKGINNFNDRVCGNSQRNTFWQIIGVFFFFILPKKNYQKTNVFLEEYPSMTTVHQSVCHQPPMLVFVLIDKTLNTFWHRLRVHPPPSNKGHPDIIPTYLRCLGNPDIYHLCAIKDKPRLKLKPKAKIFIPAWA